MTSQPIESKTLTIALWIVQALVALLFVGTGIMKLVTPIATIAAMWPWAGDYPFLVRLTGFVDLVGGLGLVVPALTRIKPELTRWAALGCALLMISAIVFHVSRGEAANTPFNFIMLALVLFIFWGRRGRASIHPK